MDSIGAPRKRPVYIQNSFTLLSALSMMIMALLYVPCAATIATIKQETNSTKWAVLSSNRNTFRLQVIKI